MIIGVLLTLVSALFYGLWKPYIKKVKLSQTEFRNAVRFVAISAFVAGFGMTLMISQDFQFGNWFTVTVSLVLCLGLYPLVQTGIFIFHMQREGFVRKVQHEKKNEGD